MIKIDEINQKSTQILKVILSKLKNQRGPAKGILQMLENNQISQSQIYQITNNLYQIIQNNSKEIL